MGMNNPYGADERYALYPESRRAAGDRLCRVILGMDKHDYMRSFIRRNTMEGAWRLSEAKVSAVSVFKELPPGAVVVLLGQQVWQAWKAVDPARLGDSRATWIPFRIQEDETQDLTYVLFPHPSGLSKLWNDKSNITLARSTLRIVCPHLASVISP